MGACGRPDMPHDEMNLYNTVNSGMERISSLVLTGTLHAWVIAVGITPVQAGELEEYRKAVRERIEMELALDAEQRDWDRRKALLRDLVEVSTAAVGDLQQELAEYSRTITDTGERRQALVEERDALESALLELQKFADRAAARLEKRLSSFPRPLREEIEPTLRKLVSEAGGQSAGGVTARMQQVVSILTAIQKFDSNVHTSYEVLPGGPEGVETEVRTIYFGLSAGFYAGGPDGAAGMGYPQDGEWRWVSRPEIASRVIEAIGVAENAASRLEIVRLPLRLPENAAGSEGRAE